MTPPQPMEPPDSTPQTTYEPVPPPESATSRPAPRWVARQTSLQNLSDLFESRQRKDKTKDEVFNNLCAEITSLPCAESVQHLKPFTSAGRRHREALQSRGEGMRSGIILGVDLGTTFSAVACVIDYGKPDVLLNPEGDRTPPSVVYFREDGPPRGR